MNRIDQERKKLVATAVLGTARSGPLPPDVEGIFRSSLTILSRENPEEQLLDEAALMINYRRAGMVVSIGSIDELPTASQESLPSCSPAAAELLKQILDGSYRDVLPEALDLFVGHQLRVPFLLLPDLLTVGARRPELRSQIVRVAGERGKWLAQFNKSWSYVGTASVDRTSEELVADWDTAKADDRLAIIHRLREMDSNLAVSLLIRSWKSETASNRQAMLSLLEPHLSSEDAPILEIAFVDKSVEVRREAVRLLSKLPLSIVRKKAIELAESSIQLKTRIFGGSEITLALPHAYDPEWSHYAIEETSYIKDIGDRAWWLVQWLGLVPPDYWSNKFGMTPSELLAAAQLSDWADALRLGWSKGAKLTNNHQWNYVLLKYWVTAADSRTSITNLVPRVGDLGPLAEALLSEILDAVSLPLHDRHPATALLRQYTGPWSEEFSRKVLANIERRSRLPKDPNQQIWLSVSLLREFAYRIPPTLASEPWFDVTRDDDEWMNWANAVNDFQNTLTFRQNLYRELES